MAALDILRQRELFYLYAVLLAACIFGRAAARRGAPPALAAVGAVNLFCSLIILGLSLAHLTAVIGTRLLGRVPFVYDFRLYSLVLLGVLLTASAALCVTAARGVAHGDRSAFRRAMRSTLFLLALNLPLMPIQGFAVAFSIFLGVNFATLAAARRHPAITAAAVSAQAAVT